MTKYHRAVGGPGLAVVLALAAGACGGASSSSGGTTKPSGASADTVTIRNFVFEPSNLTVRPGAIVTVLNEDPTPHTVTAVDGAFTTGDIQAHAARTFTAPKAGTYPYRCQIHQFMRATLTVTG